MSKCSGCKKDFTPLVKNDGLLYKTCDRCRSTDKKYRDTHKEQLKEYAELNKDKKKNIMKIIKTRLKKKQKNIVKQIRIK
jgi:hypothetical protein